MRIVEPNFEIVRPQTREQGIFCLREIERFARVSHRSEDKQTENSWERFIKAVVVDKGDWSVCEHIVATVIAKVDRGVSHEWVRHRIGSYTQESTRFVNYEKKGIEFIKPCFVGDDAVKVDAAWNAYVYEAEQNYLDMLKEGQPPQIARSVLPNATASTIVVTYNLRAWRQFFMMRCTKETHPDFRRLVIPMLAVFKERIPLLYDDIEPNQKQSISLARPR